MSSGERPIGAAKGKQSDTEALCHPPPPPPHNRTGGLSVTVYERRGWARRWARGRHVCRQKRERQGRHRRHPDAWGGQRGDEWEEEGVGGCGSDKFSMPNASILFLGVRRGGGGGAHGGGSWGRYAQPTPRQSARVGCHAVKMGKFGMNARHIDPERASGCGHIPSSDGPSPAEACGGRWISVTKKKGAAEMGRNASLKIEGGSVHAFLTAPGGTPSAQTNRQKPSHQLQPSKTLPVSRRGGRRAWGRNRPSQCKQRRVCIARMQRPQAVRRTDGAFIINDS